MKNLILPAFLLFTSLSAFAQQKVDISGTVTEPGTKEPLIGVSISIEGTTTGTVTDLDGLYTLKDVPSNGFLVFSYLGMKTQRIAIAGKTVINVVMADDTKALEEVVVVGYGTQKVKDLTAPIAVIRGSDLVRQTTANAAQALQGKVAGVQVINSGAPGAGPAVRIRGVGSIGDYAKPLYVVDGVFVDNIDFLSNNDIQTINVLKDASASAIYGVRAANGVILITTKNGVGEKPVVTYDGYIGMQVPVNLMKLTNTSQYVTLRNEANFDLSAGEYKPGYPLTVEQFNGADTNWYDALLQNALMHSHSLDVSGSTEKSNYSVGANYMYQDGIVKLNSNYSRLNIRARGDFQLSKMAKVGFSTVISKYDQQKQDDGVFFQAFINPPIYNIYDENNTDAFPVKFGSPQSVGLGNEFGNPYAKAYYYNLNESGYQIIPSVYLELKFLNDRLTFKSQYSQDLRFIQEREFAPQYKVGGSQGLRSSTLRKKTNEYTKDIFDNTLTFSDNINKIHSYSIMVGNSVRQETNPWLEGTALNVPGGSESEMYLSNGSASNRFSNDGGMKNRGVSFFSRGTYNYNNRYLATLTFRADGSSKYQQKWGYFPSAGLGWVMSDESFMQQQKFFEYLKFRASWGKLGNDNVPANSVFIVGQPGAASSGIFGDRLVDGVGAQTVYQNYMKWEVVTEMDLGFDFAALKQRLNGTIDFYNRTTSNVVFEAPVPGGGGVATLLGNNGTVLNRGLELSLEWADKLANGLGYSIGMNLTTIHNEVTEVQGRSEGYVPGAYVNGIYATRAVVGKPIGSFYGYQVEGVYQTQGDVYADPTAPAWAGPGYFNYKDVGGGPDGTPDGKIDASDITYLGSPIPTLMGGMDFGLNYKNWDFSLSLQGQFGNKILNQKRMNRGTFPTSNYDVDFYDNRWTADNKSNQYPSAEAFNNTNIQQPNSFFVENGSYIRIQNVQLGYTIPKISPTFPKIRIYASAQRPFTYFTYNGFTTEISGAPNQTGVDNAVYPMQAVYSFGVRAVF